MKPVPFPEQNAILNKGAQNETPAHVDRLTGILTACYEMTPKELEAANQNGGKIFLSVAIFPGMPYPVLGMTPTLQFREMTEEEKQKVQQQEKKQLVIQGRDRRNPNRLKKLQ